MGNPLIPAALAGSLCLALGFGMGAKVGSPYVAPPVDLPSRAASAPPAIAPSVAHSIESFFSPRGGCTNAVVKALGGAKESILVQAYSFTSAPIAQALLAASKRGVKVQIILDKSQRTANYSEADFTAHAGIPTFIDAKHAIAHNKVIVIDSETLITGSFNFTKAAEQSNAENLLIIHDPVLAARYTDNWKAHLEHSAAYAGK